MADNTIRDLLLAHRDAKHAIEKIATLADDLRPHPITIAGIPIWANALGCLQTLLSAAATSLRGSDCQEERDLKEAIAVFKSICYATVPTFKCHKCQADISDPLASIRTEGSSYCIRCGSGLSLHER